ncbi:sulfotransferase [Leptolyngbya sp. AN02str]|uniref:sulfotransferase n=1 Tax=Leptolyngbya sp. AN02str TaxID=3423363 RepID=UPI003D313623
MIHFLGIGAQKSATTWLYKNLDRHPQIKFPAGKEVHFWDRRSQDGGDAWLKLFPPCPEHIKQGEITPAYGILEPNIIQSIYEVAPSVRLIFSIRNPIERAFSSAIMALIRSQMEMHEASDQWFIDHFLCHTSRSQCNYLRSIKNWTSIYPSSSLLTIFFDDIRTHPEKVLADVSNHIEVSPSIWQDFPLDELQAVVRPPLIGDTFVVISNALDKRPSLKLYLKDLYREEIRNLSRFFERDLEYWLEI